MVGRQCSCAVGRSHRPTPALTIAAAIRDFDALTSSRSSPSVDLSDRSPGRSVDHLPSSRLTAACSSVAWLLQNSQISLLDFSETRLRSTLQSDGPLAILTSPDTSM